MKFENTKFGDYERVTDTHVYFWKGPFSQWANSEFEDPITKNIFISCEQWMMWNKAKMFDESFCEIIMKETSQKNIQLLGREIKNFDERLWNDHKYQIVFNGNLLKYEHNEKYRKLLIEAGDRIFVEASPYDKIWGVGLSQTDDKILDENNWLGENLLGKAITGVSEIIRGN